MNRIKIQVTAGMCRTVLDIIAQMNRKQLITLKKEIEILEKNNNENWQGNKKKTNVGQLISKK